MFRVSVGRIQQEAEEKLMQILVGNPEREKQTVGGIVGGWENITFFNPILFAVCTSTFSKLCKKTYTVACRRVLSSAPL
jgi:hypothetical protein